MKNASPANATALPDAIAALAAARAAKDPIDALSHNYRLADAAFVEIGDFGDYIKSDDPLHFVLARELDRRHDALLASIMAICSYSPATLDEAKFKMRLVIKATDGCVLEEDQVTALLNSFAA